MITGNRLADGAPGVAIGPFCCIFVGMNTSSREPFKLDEAWKSEPCDNLQQYLQEAYGKSDQAGHAFAFRGANDCYRNLWPSIDRRIICGPDRIKTETALLEDFLSKTRNHLTPQERKRCWVSEERWGNKRNTAAMVVAQHRCVPTRCLDWSDCPLCALFFACRGDSSKDGEVWWFSKNDFDLCAATQWRAVFDKCGHVEPDIERAFIAGDHPMSWFTAMKYERLPDDRLDRQKGWITFAGQLVTDHAEEIHRLGVTRKGRLLITLKLKLEAIRGFEQLGITSQSLGLNDGGRVDEIATEIRKKFEDKFDKRIEMDSS